MDVFCQYTNFISLSFNEKGVISEQSRSKCYISVEKNLLVKFSFSLIINTYYWAHDLKCHMLRLFFYKVLIYWILKHHSVLRKVLIPEVNGTFLILHHKVRTEI